jgi:hypothetical protein
MNVWGFSLSLSIFIWSCVFDRSLLFIYFLVTLVYLMGNIYYQDRSLNSFRGKVQLATWNDSGDPTVKGSMEIDMEIIDAIIDEFNSRTVGSRLTHTAVFAKALGEGLAFSGKMNGKIAFGKFVPSDSVDIILSVDIDGDNVAPTYVKGCNLLKISEINEIIKTDVRLLKAGKHEQFNNIINIGRCLPSFIIQPIYRFSAWLSYDCGMHVPLVKLSPDHFGYGVLTNLMSFDIKDFHVPLSPTTKTVFTATMNTPFLKPVVFESEIKIRKIMNFNIVFDHRFADGSEASKIVRRIKEVLSNPSMYL